MSRSFFSRLFSVTPVTKRSSVTKRNRKAASIPLQLEELEVRLTPSTYYVDGTNGSDSNNGESLSTPWKTINRAFDTSDPNDSVHGGDTLIIRGGTYNEFLTNVIPSGTAGDPTTIENYGNETVTLAPTGGTTSEYAIKLGASINSQTSYVTIEGNAPGEFVVDTSGVTATNGGGGLVYGTNDTLENMEFVGHGTSAAAEGMGVDDPTGSNNNSFIDLNIHNFMGNSTHWASGLYMMGNNCTIQGCDIYNTGASGLWIDKSGLVPDTGAGSSNNHIDGNKVYDTGLGALGNAAIVIGSGVGNIVYNNLVTEAPIGIELEGAPENTELYNNTVYDNNTGNGNHYGILITGTYKSPVNGNTYCTTGTAVYNNISYDNPNNYLDQSASGGGVSYTGNNLFGWSANSTNDAKFQSLNVTDANFLKLTSSATDAIDQGTSTGYYNDIATQVPTDYWGVSRPQGSAYDIGASEYVFPPAAPTNLSASGGDTQVSLSWTASSGATSYDVYRGTTSGGETLLQSGITSTNYTDTGLTNGTTYYYEVSAVNASGQSGMSNEVSATPTSSTTEYMGETNVLSLDDSGNANLLLAQNATLAQAGTLQSLSFYVTQAAGNLEMGVYDASGPGGGPGNLLAQTNSITPVVGWNTASVTTPVSLAAGNYWLAYLPSDNNLHFLKGETSGVSNAYYSYSYGAMPATFSTNPNTDPYHWSFYATLTSGTTVLLPQSQMSIDPNTTSGVANPANVLDGNTNTYATITSMPQDLVINLGGTYSVDELQQASYASWSSLQSYQIYVSTDDTNWTSVASGNFVSGANTATFAPTTASYLKLQYNNNTNGGNYCFTSEINVGVVEGGSPPAAPAMLIATPSSSLQTNSGAVPAQPSSPVAPVDPGAAAGTGGNLNMISAQSPNLIQQLEGIEMDLLTVLMQQYSYVLGLEHSALDLHDAALLAALSDLGWWKPTGGR